MEIEFIGDWAESDAAAIARSLQKSLGMGDGIAEELNPPAVSDFPSLLSARQKKLLEMLRQAGGRALELCAEGEECDSDRPDWSDYAQPMAKGLTAGQIRITPKGRFRLNQKRRWEKIDDGDGPEITAPIGTFEFPLTDGEYGRGVYLPVLPTATGGVRLRVRLALAPEQLISDEQFFDYENDLSQDTELILDSHQVRAIARSTNDGTVDLLMVREPDDIRPLGIVAGSGAIPSGTPRFNLVSLQEGDGYLTADIEMVDNGNTDFLAKSASISRHSSLQSASLLHGTKLVRTSAPPLDRALVRHAIERCKSDGLSFDAVQVCLVQGVPDFLPKMTRAFCLPSDAKVCLCPHDPQGAIASQCSELAKRLQAAVSSNAIAPDMALDILARASQLDPQWWLEGVIKRYVGAVLCERQWDVLNGGQPPERYMALLVGRGVQHWGNRRAIAECMAEDFRCAYDPAGLPNLVTMEWDAAVPGLARASQQLLLTLLEG